MHGRDNKDNLGDLLTLVISRKSLISREKLPLDSTGWDFDSGQSRWMR